MLKLKKSIMTQYDLFLTDGSSKFEVILKYDVLLGVWRFTIKDKNKITGIELIRIIVEIFNNLPITAISIEEIKAFKSSSLLCIEKSNENREEDYYKEILRLGDFEL